MSFLLSQLNPAKNMQILFLKTIISYPPTYACAEQLVFSTRLSATKTHAQTKWKFPIPRCYPRHSICDFLFLTTLTALAAFLFAILLPSRLHKMASHRITQLRAHYRTFFTQTYPAVIHQPLLFLYFILC